MFAATDKQAYGKRLRGDGQAQAQCVTETDFAARERRTGFDGKESRGERASGAQGRRSPIEERIDGN